MPAKLDTYDMVPYLNHVDMDKLMNNLLQLK